MSDTRLYDVLNVSRSASDGEIRRVSRSLCGSCVRGVQCPVGVPVMSLGVS